MSQEDFAATAGVTRRPYAEWEAGNTSPTAVQLSALASAGADVQYVVTGIRSKMALTPDERELLALYRAAPLAGKAAAVGALQGALATTPQKQVQKIKSNKGQLTQSGQIINVGGGKKKNEPGDPRK